MVPFGRVVEDHVEYDFDSGIVQRLYHLLEFHDLQSHGLCRGVGRLGRKKGHGAVSPVVLQPFPCHGIYVDVLELVEFLHGKKFHGSDAQFFEVGNFFRYAFVGAGIFRCRRCMNGEAPDMHLVYDRIVGRRDELTVLDDVLVIDDDAPGHIIYTVLVGERQLRILRVDIASPCLSQVPDKIIGDGPGVGVQEQLVFVEPVSPEGIMGPVDPVSVLLSFPQSFYPDMPYIAGLVQERIKFDFYIRRFMLLAGEKDQCY